MMEELQITSIRHGADADPKSPYVANYAESKANPYPNLPDPLILNNGTRVTTPQMWWTQRRPELVELFDREIFGREASNTPKVLWEVVSATRETNGDIPVITKKLVGHIDNSSYPFITVDIQLTLTTPANASGPVPVVDGACHRSGRLGCSGQTPAAADAVSGPYLAATGPRQGLGLCDLHPDQRPARQRCRT